MDSEAAKTAIDQVWNEAFAHRYPETGSGPRERVKEDPTTVYDALETAFSKLWEYAESEGFTNVLEEEDTPHPGQVREKYDIVDDYGDLDDYVLGQAMEDLYNRHTLIDDLVAGWD